MASPLVEAELTALWLLGRVPASVLPWPLLRAGRAGRGPGPDVREAAFLMPSGVVRSGDVEVHLRTSDWVRHGHEGDPAYANVVLHLVWEDQRAAGPNRFAHEGAGALEGPVLEAVGLHLGGEVEDGALLGGRQVVITEEMPGREALPKNSRFMVRSAENSFRKPRLGASGSGTGTGSSGVTTEGP